MTSTKLSLIDFDYQTLKQTLTDSGFEGFRADQIWHWTYVQGAKSFEEMTNLSGSMRRKLDDQFSLKRAEISKELISFDETKKWLIKFEDGNEIETVYIPSKNRGTLCISSQVGCALTCSFCHTGTQKLVRNLTVSEIVSQLMIAKDSFNDWPSTKDDRKLTNIVMMGMGEPLYNYENVAKALKIIMHSGGIKLSKRNITLSTSGIVPEIEKCGNELDVKLAISLHAVTDELRDQLVPINKKYPINQLLTACKKYSQINRERVTFEYVMLRGINDSIAEAKQLVRLIKGIPAKINIIPFNPWPGSQYQCSTVETIKQFAGVLESAGYMAPIRTPRGQDIFAACGQLKSESERISKSTMN